MFSKKYYLVLFFIIQIVALQLVAFFPALIENYYSAFFFVQLSLFLRQLFGSISISVGDILYIILLIYLSKSLFETRHLWAKNWKAYFLKTINFCAIAYFLFHFLWGLNYYRKPLFEKMNLKKDYTNRELYSFTQKLILNTNQIQFQITNDKNRTVLVPFSNQQLVLATQNGYQKLAQKHGFFTYQNASIKPSLLSVPLSYMGFSGYLNPFTNEAQYNAKAPRYGLPMTICHEMAHQIGFANESECNFIGYLSANLNANIYFKYAANTLALKYCLRTIQMQNSDKSKFYFNQLNKGIVANFNEDKEFYNKYHSFIETGFELFYDRFLKLNQQQDGIESYSKFLDLLINYDKQNTIKMQ